MQLAIASSRGAFSVAQDCLDKESKTSSMCCVLDVACDLTIPTTSCISQLFKHCKILLACGERAAMLCCVDREKIDKSVTLSEIDTLRTRGLQ